MSTPFASPAELATHLQTATQAEADAGGGDVLDTGVAAQALASASGAIRAVCGWSISEETVTDTVPVIGGCLFLPTLRLTAVSVVIAGSAVAPAAVLFWRNGVVELAAVGTAGRATVTYTHGYPDTDIPEQVRAVCLEQAGKLYQNPTAMPAVTYGTATETYFKAGAHDAPLAQDHRLLPFKLPAFA